MSRMHGSSRRGWPLLLAGLLTMGALQAQAQTVVLQPATFAASGRMGDINHITPVFTEFAPGHYSGGDCRAGTGEPMPCLSATIDTTPSLTLALTEAVQPKGYSEIQINADYFYAVVGTPSFVGNVHLRVSALLNYSVTGDPTKMSLYATSAAISSTREAIPVTTGFSVGCSNAGNCSATTESGSFSVVVAPNTQYHIAMVMIAKMLASANDADMVLTAFADPVISFEPGVDTTGLSIVVSSGIPNDVAAVPEPRTAGLMLAGLTLLGWRRQRRVSMTSH